MEEGRNNLRDNPEEERNNLRHNFCSHKHCLSLSGALVFRFECRGRIAVSFSSSEVLSLEISYVPSKLSKATALGTSRVSAQFLCCSGGGLPF